MMVLNEVVCQGNELFLSDCNVYKNLNGIGNCDSSEYAGVRCESKYFIQSLYSIDELWYVWVLYISRNQNA